MEVARVLFHRRPVHAWMKPMQKGDGELRLSSTARACEVRERRR